MLDARLPVRDVSFPGFRSIFTLFQVPVKLYFLPPLSVVRGYSRAKAPTAAKPPGLGFKVPGSRFKVSG